MNSFFQVEKCKQFRGMLNFMFFKQGSEVFMKFQIKQGQDFRRYCQSQDVERQLEILRCKGRLERKYSILQFFRGEGSCLEGIRSMGRLAKLSRQFWRSVVFFYNYVFVFIRVGFCCFQSFRIYRVRQLFYYGYEVFLGGCKKLLYS